MRSVVSLVAFLLVVTPAALADYDAGARRDPFVSPGSLAVTAPAWDQVRPTVVLTSATEAVALVVGGPAGEGLVVRVGDTLGSATVSRIDAARGAVVLLVPEPMSVRGFREVPLLLAGRD